LFLYAAALRRRSWFQHEPRCLQSLITKSKIGIDSFRAGLVRANFPIGFVIINARLGTLSRLPKPTRKDQVGGLANVGLLDLTSFKYGRRINDEESRPAFVERSARAWNDVCGPD